MALTARAMLDDGKSASKHKWTTIFPNPSSNPDNLDTLCDTPREYVHYICRSRVPSLSTYLSGADRWIPSHLEGGPIFYSLVTSRTPFETTPFSFSSA
jgi:hypothetical protein